MGYISNANGIMFKTLWGECCANVSSLLMNDEFAREEPSKPSALRSNHSRTLWLVAYCNCEPLLVRGLLFWHVPQAAAFNQAVKVFCQVGRVVSSALQGLGHEQDLEVGCVSLGYIGGKVLLKQGVANAINFLVHLQYFARALQVKSREALVDQVEHIAQHDRHFHQL